MNNQELHAMLLPEDGYAEEMESRVLPYLEARMSTGYCERENGRRIFYAKALADNPKGVVIISHGYTETVEKYLENIYYFLRGGYHVFMPEHCGHGRSYRLVNDLSLVHVDDYMRYVNDLLFVSRMAAKEFPQLPVCLFGHSMGGGIAAAAAAHAPSLFSRLILSAPMIRPSTAPFPWAAACLIAGFFNITGRQERYITGHRPYDGSEQFADNPANSHARFCHYKNKRDGEPLFQMNAASYGWFWQAARLNRYIQAKAYRKISCPVLVFQAECDSLVSNTEQAKFVGKLNACHNGNAQLITVSGVKHEIFNSNTDFIKECWHKVLGITD